MQTITKYYPQGVILPTNPDRSVLEVFGSTVNALPTPYTPKVVPTGELHIPNESTVHSTTSTEIHVAELNEDSQYWELETPLNVDTGDVLSIDFFGKVVPEDKTMFFFGDPTYKFGVFASSEQSNVFEGYGGKTTLTQEAVEYGVTLIPTQGVHRLTFTVSRSGLLTQVGSRQGTSGASNIALFNFRVSKNGVITNAVPMTHRTQGSHQRPSIGTVALHLRGYTEGVWDNAYLQ